MHVKTQKLRAFSLIQLAKTVLTGDKCRLRAPQVCSQKAHCLLRGPARAALQQHAQAAPRQRAPCMAQSALHGSRLTDGPFPDAGNTKAALKTGRPLCHGAARQHLIMPGAARGLTPGPALPLRRAALDKVKLPDSSALMRPERRPHPTLTADME